jgi:hypothetical protein
VKGIEGQKNEKSSKTEIWRNSPMDIHESHLRDDFYVVCICVLDFRITKEINI